MCVLYVSFGSKVRLRTFDALPWVVQCCLFTGSGVNRVQGVLSGFGVRLFCFSRQKLYVGMGVCIFGCIRGCVCRCDVVFCRQRSSVLRGCVCCYERKKALLQCLQLLRGGIWACTRCHCQCICLVLG